jgi:hypothetical protein
MHHNFLKRIQKNLMASPKTNVVKEQLLSVVPEELLVVTPNPGIVDFFGAFQNIPGDITDYKFRFLLKIEERNGRKSV